MAYTAPDGDNVQFHFTVSGYVAPTGDAVHFNFVEDNGIRLLLDQQWKTVSGTIQFQRLDQQYVVEARILQSLRLNQTWDTQSRLTAQALIDQTWKTTGLLGNIATRLDQQWKTEFSLGQRLRLDQQWLTDAVFARLLTDQQWNTRAYVSVALRLDQQYVTYHVIKSPLGGITQQWATVETPNGKLLLDQQWFTLALNTKTLRLDQQWVVLSGGSVLFLSDEQWETFVSTFEFIRLDQMWKYAMHVYSELEIVYGNQVVSELEVSYPLGGNVVRSELEVRHDMTTRVASELELRHDIKTTNTVASELVISSPIFDQSAVQVTSNPTLTIGSNTIVVEDAEIAFDEGQFAWTCQITLFDPAHFSLFKIDDEFTVSLNGETFTFMVDNKQLSRNGPTDLVTVLAGISPSARFAHPRATPITKTWGTVLVVDVVEELFGVGVVQWEILNWSLPADTLAAQNQSPMDILQLIAQAAGAVVISDPDGTLRVRYRYPISVPQYETAVPDQTYSDDEHNFSLAERTPNTRLENKIRVMDEQPGGAGVDDSIEFKLDEADPKKAVLKVFPSPWRDDVLLEHTSNSQVSVTPLGIKTEELEETVEVVSGAGSLSHPIYNIVSVTWLYVNLTSVEFEQDKPEFKTTHPTLKESLVKIKYTTRYWAFDTAGPEAAEVQYLARDPE